MTKGKKIVLKYKVTNKNILIRFKREQRKEGDIFKEKQKEFALKNKGRILTKWDNSFTLNKLAERFGILNINGVPDKTLVCRWISLKENIQRLPSKTRLCPQCRKSVFEHVEDWINDGSLN